MVLSFWQRLRGRGEVACAHPGWHKSGLVEVHSTDTEILDYFGGLMAAEAEEAKQEAS